MSNSKKSFPRYLLMALLSGLPNLAYSQADSAPEGQQTLWWVLIGLFVLAVTAASAALPLAAVRVWHKRWRIAALLPLLVLALWCAVIALSRWLEPGSRSLWLFEIFAWAMLNMIYMVALMTAKRIIDKADEKEKLST